MSDNVYDDPEKFGLELLGTADAPGLCYEFDMFAVWRRIEDGKLFCATSAGCSCPTPFEEYPTVESLDACADIAEVKRQAHLWANDDAGMLIEANRLIAAIRSELGGAA